MTDDTRRSLVPPVAALALLAASVPAGAEVSEPAPGRAVEIQGHRGARAMRPENTMAAFAYALAVGADVLEMDVVVTKDGVPVVHHDLELDPLKCRMRDGSPARAGFPLRAMTLAEVRALDCGATATSSPTSCLARSKACFINGRRALCPCASVARK